MRFVTLAVETFPLEYFRASGTTCDKNLKLAD